MDVWVADLHPVYFVMADGERVDEMVMRPGFARLTRSQRLEIAENYREALSW